MSCGGHGQVNVASAGLNLLALRAYPAGMIKSDLVARIAAQNPHLYEKDCEAVVNTILARIADALAAGDRVELRGFGAFSIKTMRPRQRRNLRTGEKVDVTEK